MTVFWLSLVYKKAAFCAGHNGLYPLGAEVKFFRKCFVLRPVAQAALEDRPVPLVVDSLVYAGPDFAVGVVFHCLHGWRRVWACYFARILSPLRGAVVAWVPLIRRPLVGLVSLGWVPLILRPLLGFSTLGISGTLSVGILAGA